MRPSARYSASWLASQTIPAQHAFLKSLSANEIKHLRYDWDFWARDKQILPEQPFFIWLILAGRGFGKTRTGAETVRKWIKNNRYVNLIGATADDARDIMIEGESGVLAICPDSERPAYIKTARKLEWPNGATSLIFTADEPERLRGKQHMKLWADEIASWRYPASWDQAMMGLRLGTQPQAVVTTTPRAVKFIMDLVSDSRNVVITGTTYENRANLAQGFYDYVITKYEGTRLGRQELLAQILTDNPGALWQRKNIDDQRVTRAPALGRIVVAVDPSATSTGDEAGIVTIGLDGRDLYILSDDSLQASPLAWATAAVTAYYKYQADCIVAESNNGGEMVSQTIATVDANVPVKLVHASRGKQTRAEPVAAVYEQGRGHHVGVFAALEDELVMWVPGDASPNRLDALVWGASELLQIGELARAEDVTDLGKLERFKSRWS